jgi:hypothetical protein
MALVRQKLSAVIVQLKDNGQVNGRAKQWVLRMYSGQ